MSEKYNSVTIIPIATADENKIVKVAVNFTLVDPGTYNLPVDLLVRLDALSHYSVLKVFTDLRLAKTPLDAANLLLILKDTYVSTDIEEDTLKSLIKFLEERQLKDSVGRLQEAMEKLTEIVEGTKNNETKI